MGLSAAAGALPSVASAQRSRRKPNILFIMADDHTSQAIGCYGLRLSEYAHTNNIDFAELFLDYAGAAIPETMQGRSFRQNLLGKTPDDWRDAMYYHYWSHASQRPSHYGIRTQRYKLIYYYGLVRMKRKPEECWELYDLQNDPYERFNLYDNPEHKETIANLKRRLEQLRRQYKDTQDPLRT